MTEEFHFMDFVSVLRRRSRVVLAFGVTGTALVSLVVLVPPPRYTATAQILIEAQGLVGAQATFVEQSPDQAAVLSAVTALSAHDLLKHTLASLPRDPAFRAAVTELKNPRNGPGAGWRGRLHGLLPVPWLTATGAPGPLSLRRLTRHLDIFQDRGSHVVSVSVNSISPGEAAAVANKLTQLYVTEQEEQKRAATDRALAWLGARIPELRRDVDRVDAAAQAYQSTHKLVDSKRAVVTDQELEDLNRQLSTAEADLAERQTRLLNARTQLMAGVHRTAAAEDVGSPAQAELHRQESELLLAQAELGVRYSANYPKVLQLGSQLREVRQQIARETGRVIVALKNDVALAAVRVATIRHRLGAVEAASTDVHLHSLEREASANRQLYETLLQRREELQQQRQSLSPGVNILSLASPPDRPSSPSPYLFMIPAVIISLTCGTLVALAREGLDKTLRSERDVVEVLGVPCVGLVPQLRRIGRHRPHEWLRNRPFNPYTEAIRSLVAALHLAAQVRAAKVILFSSSVPGEGKTTLAVSFAAYVAMLGRRVLLIDLDFRNPQILRELGGQVPGDALNCIRVGALPAEVIQHSAALQLDYLAIPRLPIDPMTAFMGGHLARLLDLLREKYDCVVIDSAPLIAITETRILASMVDKVVFAVKWGSTQRRVVQNALAILRNSGFSGRPPPDLAGVVITQVDLRRHALYRYGDSGEVVMRYGQRYARKNTASD